MKKENIIMRYWKEFWNVMSEKEKSSMEKIKCPQCLKMVQETETDNCDKCEKRFCAECLIYHGEKDSEGELAFCEKCEKE